MGLAFGVAMAFSCVDLAVVLHCSEREIKNGQVESPKWIIIALLLYFTLRELLSATPMRRALPVTEGPLAARLESALRYEEFRNRGQG